ncbi:MAG: bifunctional proline dehydrogenase/L-glutamate gamma-semialdehyde dehydrogenase [Anaerolineae bacterium]|nr:bifunctional proline dehydrogenase/L-glutamate gamma-semialdehyde dehydrogenase [Anaerolineae bacterium]
MSFTTHTETVERQTMNDQLAKDAVALAEQLLATAKHDQTEPERQQANKIAGMMHDKDGKKVTMLMLDQAFRSENAGRVADQIRYLVDKYGNPEYLQVWEQLALSLGNFLSQLAPTVVVPFIVSKLRQETKAVILPSEQGKFTSYLAKRRAMGTRINVNQLGEAILGEGEAKKRLDAYLDLLAKPEIEYISVKISSIFSQIHLVAFDHTVEEIKERLRKLYRQAMKYPFQQPDGTTTPKFVNLDMEEYRDLHLTVAAFTQVLDEAEFKNYRAGIVLQAYLPDSSQVQRDLTAWAQQRVADGGAPIKLRIVKGANLAMEKVEAANHGWPQAPYLSKHEVDANFKRMVTYGCNPERAKAVNLGIASHNLFDVSYGILLREAYDLYGEVEFEMLEGMANHQARAVQDRARGLLLYAPVVKRSDFHSAIAYLVRRLDENTAEENFLHDLFDLEPGTPAWNAQRDRFLNAVNAMNSVADVPNRQQDRSTEEIEFDLHAPFDNVPDTDFSLRQNQKWVAEAVARWQKKVIDDIPLQISGKFVQVDTQAEGHSPSHPGKVIYRYALARPDQIDAALNTAVAAKSDWQALNKDERKDLLVHCADVLSARRGDLIGAMVLEGGKTVEQADPEVSEAIDFANYYARTFDDPAGELDNVTFDPLGVVLITPPWNFPLAIPAGGTLAALMAGNTVLFKPAPEAVLLGWLIVNAFWDAGVPRDVLQFVPTTDDEVGKALVTDDRVDGVILTGAYETARMFLGWKPEMRLFAETSGKNSMIITAMADRDQAVKDLVKSAFGHAGQKCSAASLGILEAEVYDSPSFLSQLKDAAESLAVGPSHVLCNVMSPVIHEPEAKLKRALTQLEPGESWLLEPQMVDGNPNLWSPGIKLGVKPESFFHLTECFGPVLGLMRANDLDHAIQLANAVDYGLTSGLQSLDDREIAKWREAIHAGNAYVNRVTTGAIVQRQPFGGWKRSAFGYAKAGGPNYTFSLGHWHDKAADNEALLKAARDSYQQAWKTHFSVDHDPSQVLGESNVFRYKRIKRMILRVDDSMPSIDFERIVMASNVCGVPLRVSLKPGTKLPVDVSQVIYVSVVEETDEALIASLRDEHYRYWQRLRILGDVSPAIRLAAIEAHVPLIEAPVVSNGRIELRHYMLEQAISQTTHRYGNLLTD